MQAELIVSVFSTSKENMPERNIGQDLDTTRQWHAKIRCLVQNALLWAQAWQLSSNPVFFAMQVSAGKQEEYPDTLVPLLCQVTQQNLSSKHYFVGTQKNIDIKGQRCSLHEAYFHLSEKKSAAKVGTWIILHSLITQGHKGPYEAGQLLQISC